MSKILGNDGEVPWIVILQDAVIILTIATFIAVVTVRIGTLLHFPGFISLIASGAIFYKVEKKLQARLEEADEIIMMRELL